jgi:hypothetical protein
MSQVLGIIVKDLKGAMVNVRPSLAGAEEERVVVRMVLTQVQVHECRHVHSVAVLFHVKQVCWNYIEMGGVK